MIPHLLSSFIGRQREIDEIRRLLSEHHLVTLSGPGGCGKTRLAIEVAAKSAADFEDQVWFVELAAFSDPALVVRAVASALDIREQPGSSLSAMLLDALRSRHGLLLLDNCEHLVEPCAALAHTLLPACPGLTLLATSREPLRIDGELVWTVPPLSFPERDRELSNEELESYDALCLFLDRARHVLPTFALTPRNTPALIRICRELDGMPLAIELAAARMRVLSVEQLAVRLDQVFLLLTGGSRTALPRQQSLQATIEWSYELLTERERLLFMRLSVFVGGWTLEAAEAVCADEQLERNSILDLLMHLVDKSLVVVMEREEVTRYRLLVTVRQYAWKKLEQGGEAGRIQQRYTAFFVHLVEEAVPQVRSSARASWLRHLDMEHDNLRAILGRAKTAGNAGDIEIGLHVSGLLSWFWYFRGYFSEAMRWLRDLLTASPAPTPGRGLALFGAGAMAWVQGDYRAAHGYLDEGVTLWRRQGDKQNLAFMLTLFGLIAALLKEYQVARAAEEESVGIFREVGDVWGQALALYWYGETMRLQRRHAEAIALYEESQGCFRAVNDTWGRGLTLQGLGAVAYRLGNDGAASVWLEEALTLRREAGDRWLLAQSLNTLGLVLLRQGEYVRATACFEEGLHLSREVADMPAVITLFANLGRACLVQRDYSRARHCFQEGLQLAHERGLERWKAECSQGLEQVVLAEEKEQSGEVEPLKVQVAEPALRVLAFGRGQVYRAGTLLTSSDWVYAKVRELLYYLLCYASRTRPQIGLALWPDASPTQLRSNFHDTLYHLRRVLGGPEWIVFAGGAYTFNRQLSYWFDVEAFETGILSAQQIITSEPEQAITHLETACSLYTGDFLSELVEGDWTTSRREELRRTYQEALLTLGQLYYTGHHFKQAARTYRRVLASDNYLEAAHRELMRCYDALGERSQALRHYQAFKAWLWDELGAAPAPETTALFKAFRQSQAN